MKITVIIKPNSKQSKIKQVSETNFNVWVKSPATEGKANQELLSLLSKHFKKPKSLINIIRGSKSKTKIIIFN